MDKLKNVLSHGSRKSEHGQGSHLEQARQGHDTSAFDRAAESHPIYDEFTNQSPLKNNDAPAAGTDGPIHSSNLTSGNQSSTLRPDAFHGNPGSTDQNSTASVKSGVMGLPQRREDAGSVTVTGLNAASTSQETKPVVGGTAVPSHGLHRQPSYDDLKTKESSSPVRHATRSGRFEQSSQEPVIETDTDRSFPLAGGVTSRRDEHPQHDSKSHAPSAMGREPASQSQNTPSSANNGRNAAAAASGFNSHPETQRLSHGGDALEGATFAHRTIPEPRQAGDKTGHVAFKGRHDAFDPCLEDDKTERSAKFTSGPHHRTDTANRIDPHLHVPGEFPETPMETPGERSQGQGSYVSGASGHPAPETSHEALKNTETSSNGRETKRDESHSKDHRGLGAAAVGPAALGVYGAQKHKTHESSDVEQEPVPPSTNPYSSTRVDPRVDTRPAGDDKPAPHTTEPNLDTSHEAVVNAHSRSQGLGRAPQGTDRNIDTSDEAVANAHSRTQGLGRDYQADNQEPKVHTSHQAVANAHSRAQGLGRTSHADNQPSEEHRSDDRNAVLGIVPGYGGPQAATEYTEHRSDPIRDSLDNQRYDPSAPQAHDPNQASHNNHGRDAALAVGAGGLAYGASHTAVGADQPTSGPPSQQPQVARQTASRDVAAQDHDAAHDPQHHYGSNAAVGAAGIGAAGAGLYAASRSEDDNVPHSHEAEKQSSQHQRYDSAQQPAQGIPTQPEPHHRNVPARTNLAAGGVAVAGAGAGAGYAYAQHDPQEAENQRLAQQKAQGKELEHQRKVQQKELEKQQKHDRKAHEKGLAHDRKEQEKEHHRKEKEQQKAFAAHQNELQKEHTKEQKHHDKLVAAEAKAHRKEAERQERAHEKEVDRENARLQREREDASTHEGKEKKHHLFGFLHHKDKKESPDRSPRTSKEYASGNTIGQEDHGSRRSSGSHEGRHKLHKDPPPGHPAWQVLEQQEQEKDRADDVHHPLQVPGNDTLHSGVYEAPNLYNSGGGVNTNGYGDQARY